MAVSFFLTVAGVLLFMSLHGGDVRTAADMADQLNGQDSPAPLVLPFVLFVAGAGGFLAALDWTPRGRDGGRSTER